MLCTECLSYQGHKQACPNAPEQLRHICRSCGKEADVFYLSKNNKEILGCDRCIIALDEDEVTYE